MNIAPLREPPTPRKECWYLMQFRAFLQTSDRTRSHDPMSASSQRVARGADRGQIRSPTQAPPVTCPDTGEHATAAAVTRQVILATMIGDVASTGETEGRCRGLLREATPICCTFNNPAAPLCPERPRPRRLSFSRPPFWREPPGGPPRTAAASAPLVLQPECTSAEH